MSLPKKRPLQLDNTTKSKKQKTNGKDMENKLEKEFKKIREYFEEQIYNPKTKSMFIFIHNICNLNIFYLILIIQ